MEHQPPASEKEKQIAFVAMRFNPEEGEEFAQWGTALLRAIEESGITPRCLVQEEQWGQSPSEHPLVDAAAILNKTDMLLIDISRGSGFGTGWEAGYARAKHKPVVLLVSKEHQNELTSTRKDASDTIIVYENFPDLTNKLRSSLLGIKARMVK